MNLTWIEILIAIAVFLAQIALNFYGVSVMISRRMGEHEERVKGLDRTILNQDIRIKEMEAHVGNMRENIARLRGFVMNRKEGI